MKESNVWAIRRKVGNTIRYVCDGGAYTNFVENPAWATLLSTQEEALRRCKQYASMDSNSDYKAVGVTLTVGE